MRWVVGLSVLALSGCTSLSGAQQTCSSLSPSYLVAWDCIRGKVAAGQAGDMNNDLGLRYMATGDAIAERVRSGRMTNAEANLALAEELSRGNADYEARRSERIRRAAAIQSVTQQPRPLNCTSNVAGSSVYTNCY